MVNRIFLMGYMGAGKTKVGMLLAEALHLSFLDLDAYIEEKYGQRIADIFAEQQECGFREIEKACLHEVASKENIIISLGGGAPCYQDNMAFMNQCGTTLYIRVAAAELARRLNDSSSKDKRPLIRDLSPEALEATIVSMLKIREPYYMQAKCIVETGNQSKEDSMKRILEALSTPSIPV